MHRRLALVLASLAVLLCGTDGRGEEYYAQEKCSLCHIRQSVFFDAKFAGPEGLKEFGEERACDSCHNGSVQDSRAVLWRGAQHPSPAGKADGKRCSRCHNPHSKGGWEVLSGTSVSLRKGGNGLCAGCHAQHGPGTWGIHRKGFAEGGCRECHQAHGGVGKALLREDRATLCLRCHSALAGAGGHPLSRVSGGPGGGKGLPECTGCHPVHRRETKDVAATAQCGACHSVARTRGASGGKRHPGEDNCLTCHSFHAKSGDMGRRFRGKEIRPDILCARCHDARRAESVRAGSEKGTHVTSVSGGKEDICFRCHRIHEAAPGTALLVSAKAYSCLQCHAEQNTIRETGGIDLAHPVFERVTRGRLAAVVRARNIRLGAAGEIVCTTCHTVHNATRKTPLLVFGAEGSEICFWCHEKMRGTRHVRAESPSVRCATCHPIHGRRNLGSDPWKTLCSECHARSALHGPDRLDGAFSAPRGLPGFDARGRKAAIGSISCPTCHEPHGTERREKGLRKTYSSSGFLCTACHGNKETVALTPHDLRGIAGKSICEPCHLPHGGSSPWMLGLPVGTGERGEEACRSCHNVKGLGSPVAAGGHPMNMIVPRPLPEVFPLFGGNGRRQRSGVLTCATCHEGHGTGVLPTGGASDKLLRAAPCLPCHAGKETSHGKADCRACHPPHQEKKAAGGCATCHKMEGKGMAPVHARGGKGCDVCHKIHSAGTARETAGVPCASCHAKEARVAGTAHAAQGAGPCGGCHRAHVDIEPPVVRVRAWEERFLPDMPCRRCHQEGGRGPVLKWMEHPKTRRKVPTSYGATVTLETPVTMFGSQQDAGRPLFPFFGEDGKPAMGGRMGCLTCHDPHAGVLKGSQRTAAGYLRDPSGVFLSDICASCHAGNAAEHAGKFHELPRKTE